MQMEVRVPEVGSDPVKPILVSYWFAEEGDEVIEGDRLVELVVGSATFDVPAPASGMLAETVVEIDDPVQEGDVLGIVAAEGEPED